MLVLFRLLDQKVENHYEWITEISHVMQSMLKTMDKQQEQITLMLSLKQDQPTDERN